MLDTDMIIARLREKFPSVEGNIRSNRVRRIWVTVDEAIFRQAFEFIARDLECNHLATITGLDDGENLSFMYHLAHRSSGIIVNLRRTVPKTAPVITTVTDLYPSAANYERELKDLFGAQVEGLPQGNRYPLPDEFPTDQYPLRKEWKVPEHVVAPTVVN